MSGLGQVMLLPQAPVCHIYRMEDEAYSPPPPHSLTELEMGPRASLMLRQMLYNQTIYPDHALAFWLSE